MSNYEADSDFEQLVNRRQDSRNPNYATFYLHPKLNKKKSEEAGREIYEDKTYILILCPGQSKTETRRPADENDKREYPEAWKAFLDGNASPLIGTPIEQLPTMTPARAKEMHRQNIRTIEQLVAVPDQNMPMLGIDAFTLRNQAKAFIEKNTSEIQSLRQQNQILSNKLAAQSRQLLELSEKLDKLGSLGQQPGLAVVPKPEVDSGAIPNE